MSQEYEKNAQMIDYSHFVTNDGLIFIARGNNQPISGVRAAAIYRPCQDGSRLFNGQRYKKEVDEFGGLWLGQIRPDYFVDDDLGPHIIVPNQDIRKWFDPFIVLDETRARLRKKWPDLISEIEGIVPREDIGFIGSYLLGFQNEKSDIDMIIRGLNNLNKIRANFKGISERLNSVSWLDQHRLETSLKKYHSIYSEANNNFSEMIGNRWPTIRTNDFMTKLRFAYKDGEEPKIPSLNKKVDEIVVEGRVIDDLGVNFMPRVFRLSSGNEEFNVQTYFWDFTYCVKKGDKIKVKASRFEGNSLFICNPSLHGIKFN